jgi:hypothetical protein
MMSDDATLAAFDTPAAAGRDTGGRWQPGVSGNPAGRPKGSRNRAGRLLDVRIAEHVEAISATLVRLACFGNVTALRMCVQRLSPPVKQARIAFELPAMASAADAACLHAAVLQAVSEGELSPSEGSEVSRLIETAARSFANEEAGRRAGPPGLHGGVVVPRAGWPKA